MLFPKPQHKRRPKPKVQKIILQTEKVCYKTGSPYNLDPHHIFDGSWRPVSERYGLVVWLRRDWHTGENYCVHKDPDLDLFFQRLAMTEFEKIYDHETFMRLFDGAICKELRKELTKEWTKN